MRWPLLLGALAVLVVAGSLATASSAQPNGCTAAGISHIEYQGMRYRGVPLALERQGALETVSLWIQHPPCNDVAFAPPRPPSPPTRHDFPLARLRGIPPSVAVAAANKPDWIWVTEACTAGSPMDVAVRCLGLNQSAAYRAAKATGMAPTVTTSKGTFPLIVRSSTTCTTQPATPTCETDEGFMHRYPHATARFGEKVRFAFASPVESVAIAYGKQSQPLVELPAGYWALNWRVPASGKYTLTIVVRGSTPAFTRETTYALRVHARR